MAVKAVVPFLVAMMLLTGVCNTLLTKYQDMQCVENCNASSKKDRGHFEQPVLQTLQMFIGEMGCWLVIGIFSAYKRYVSRRAGYEALPVSNDDVQGTTSPARSDESEATAVANPLKPAHADDEGRIPLVGRSVLLLAIPACCDIAGTTLMNVGLLFVAASIYQMTRGALVLFVGLFSVWFLKRHLGIHKWLSLFVVVFGVAVVGLAGAITKDDKATPSSFKDATVATAPTQAVRTMIGMLLIAGAQIFTATQFVVEERIMEKYSMEPIRVVGWEGIFGFSVTLVVMVILHFAIGTGYFNASEGLYQITHFPAIAVSSLLIMISIG
jgi:drug/metabolite transporter (DMT)-like permease